IDAADAMVLGPDAVMITSPYHIAAKAKGKPEYKGQGVWTGVFQRRGGKWTVVETHMSDQHADAMMAALTPAPTKGAKAPAKTPPKDRGKKPAAKSTTKKK